jgi:hypothetical protein
MFDRQFTGDIANMIQNRDDLYTGVSLSHYFRVIMNAPNIHHGYHGLRHMLHVTWVCYQACKYYNRLGQMSKREARNLLIAAMFHDYGHCGQAGDDALNIEAALDGLREHVDDVDRDYLVSISQIILATQFPHADLGDSPSLGEQVIRDADISQAFGTTWIGDIAAGFGSELDKDPVAMLEQQLMFLKDYAKFHSDFGKAFFGQEAVSAKYYETSDLLSIMKA